ncbi:DNA alkylation repair protein [Leptospira gomenensis]|uniref:DNA alkylation repair protein n=1 Tax=Leptospira gomenensis TaxID=2484974 RepID=A0A5F1YFS7_9LEPT|nr:DNA alkylation repair protein [Leptospira gomenensis]TGK39249.1 DNA alkylation repair protein [Leptospira gomenensis]TGK44005.1 DNA alkylation repair protein [Leptospira gomenensis]TGK48919.1 DNA alkylation repair protein [Leptospira gomenensis]TGK54629.1 DNA alkylation repair protein [Leptospira gomenensis]
MDSINSKKEIKTILSELWASCDSERDFLAKVESELLLKKTRFPLLEFAALEIHSRLTAERRNDLLEEIGRLRHMGGYVIAGMMLQLDLESGFEEALAKAGELMISGDEWYVCDIVGERVFGHSLLFYPERTIPILKKYLNHENGWIVRSVGVASHYAVKKGLEKKHVETLFYLLLEKLNATDFHTKKGIGWGIKTIAKFHPDLVRKISDRLEDDLSVNVYFKNKIRIGLGKSVKYASKRPNPKRP